MNTVNIQYILVNHLERMSARRKTINDQHPNTKVFPELNGTYRNIYILHAGAYICNSGFLRYELDIVY